MNDSKLTYILCHLFSSVVSLGYLCGLIWLSIKLETGLVLWALLLTPSYTHDFNRSDDCDDCDEPDEEDFTT